MSATGTVQLWALSARAVRGPRSNSRGVAVRPIWAALGLRVSTGDQHASIPGGVAGPDHRRVGAEGVVEGGRGLTAQLLAVHHEQRLAQLAGFGDALEKGGGNEGLASPGGRREQRPRRRALFAALGQLLQHGADGGILVVV